MAKNSKISWTTSTFNPWRGCTKVSPGCTHCYADTLSRRNPKVLGKWGPKGTRVLASETQWREPVRWHDQARGLHLVFCASLADVFEDWDGGMLSHRGLELFTDRGQPYALDDARTRLWDLIRRTPGLTWQLLTKRPENIGRMMPAGEWPNVWLGTSVEDQEYAWRLDALLDAPQKVPVHFCSAEPLLGPLQIAGSLGKQGISWVIVGGESGSGARGFDVRWCQSLIEQCREAGAACFVKQAGDDPYDGGYAIPMATRKGTSIHEWPMWMRVQQLPVQESTHA